MKDKQLRDNDWMNFKNISSLLRALSADEKPKNSSIFGWHSKFRDALFTWGLLYMLLKRQNSAIDEHLISSCQDELYLISVFKLKIKNE